MVRMPRPWFRRSRGEWYTTTDGKQLPLGVTDPADEGAAWAALRKLMKEAAGEASAESAAPGLKAGTVADLVEQFLADRSASVQPDTLAGYRKYLKWLVGEFGHSRPRPSRSRRSSGSRRPCPPGATPTGRTPSGRSGRSSVVRPLGAGAAPAQGGPRRGE